ncbi:MAG TPA: cytochrome d ubiquinol oxidase subunit II [Nitrospira sp.]|nr:cytochrome d ubiquinol oxidase subunit II [Nitrospira sp.]
MSIDSLWFVIVVMMFAVYAVLDGFNFGTGMVYMFVARTDRERQLVMKAIGPVWKGNEVWLIAGGGVLFLAFPKAFAAGFSGFYLALNLVLWLLILRGLSIPLRSHFQNPLWRDFWDAIFASASLLLAMIFGAAVGNIIRGVSLAADGYFFAPLWTTFMPGDTPGIIDWFTMLVGVLTIAILAVHGANYLAIKTDAAIRSRALQIAVVGMRTVTVLALVVSCVLPFVQPALQHNYDTHPIGYMFPATAASLLIAALYGRRRWRDGLIFLIWTLFILTVLGSMAWGLFPNLLIATADPTHSLTIDNAAASPYGLQVGVVWFSVGISLVIAYTCWVYLLGFRGKVDR